MLASAEWTSGIENLNGEVRVGAHRGSAFSLKEARTVKEEIANCATKVNEQGGVSSFVYCPIVENHEVSDRVVVAVELAGEDVPFAVGRLAGVPHVHLGHRREVEVTQQVNLIIDNGSALYAGVPLQKLLDVVDLHSLFAVGNDPHKSACHTKGSKLRCVIHGCCGKAWQHKGAPTVF